MLDAGPKALQQINFTGNLERTGNITKFFITEEVKETILDFSQGTAKLLKARPMNFVEYWYKMTEYHSVNANLSDFQLNKLKSTAKNATGITLKLSPDMVGTEENNFLHNSL